MMGPVSRKAGYAIKPLTRPTVLAHIDNEADYEQATALLNILLDAVRDDASHPLYSLVSVVGDSIEAYEIERDLRLG
jgi:HTH-type transcriptional regulator/antitoxin HigA